MTISTLTPGLLQQMDAYWRAANYLSVGQIYLYDNPLLKRPLALADVKRMLLGHWGTTSGQNFIYTHLRIGEQSASIRARICEGLGFLGIELHDGRNADHAAVISADASRVTVRVIPTNEELMIARSVSRVLRLGADTTERES